MRIKEATGKPGLPGKAVKMMCGGLVVGATNNIPQG